MVLCGIAKWEEHNVNLVHNTTVYRELSTFLSVLNPHINPLRGRSSEKGSDTAQS